MEIKDIDSAEKAKYLLEQSNYWTDTGNDTLFFFVDANFFVLIPILCFKVNFYTVGFLISVFIFMVILRKKDISFFEFVSTLKVKMIGSKYRRRK